MVISVFTVLGIFDDMDNQSYDMMLGHQKEIEESPLILFVDIDDISLTQMGTWPWTRDILADSLIRLKEFGAEAAIFDIEYVSNSSKAVDANISSITNEVFSSGEASITREVNSFAEKIESGVVVKNQAKENAKKSVENIDNTIYGMYQRISDNLEKDNDDYFARAIQFFGRASLTINTRDIKIPVSEEDYKYAYERFLFDNVTDPSNFIERNNDELVEPEDKKDFVPAIHKIIDHAYSLGFTNVIVDGDGSRRRVELMAKKDDKYAFQLAFSPLMHIFDVRSFERKRNSLIVYDALLPGETERETIEIPLDSHGCMLINWMHKPYLETFRHDPAVNMNVLDSLERDVFNSLSEINVSDLTSFSEADREFLRYAEDLLFEYMEIMKEKSLLLSRCNGFDINGNAIGGGLTQEDYDVYFKMRSDYFEDVVSYLEAVVQSINGSLDIPAVYKLYESLDDYLTFFEEEKQLYKGSICLFGNTATGSTDMGVMPFARRYPNLGTHGNIINTILYKSFIRPVSVWYGDLLSLLLTLLVVILLRKKRNHVNNIAGLLYVVLPPLTFYFLMVVYRIFIPPTGATVFVFVVYIAELACRFANTSREKNFIQQKFGAYVAPEVVNEILKNPAYANIGGETRELTALFSDVKSFSGFTECINNEEEAKGESGAKRLVTILNEYLGVLSDAIMEQKGTIDKYVGDEIVSFFGAPIENPNHAFDACVAAIRMLQAEKIYNETHLEELPVNPQTGKPFLLNSRVGLNTGDMVVGNMGTSKKLNFTVMGNNVNLASRLEGTNKVYGSWIMCSESTWLKANEKKNEGLLVARAFDCVKVINVEKPIRIYNVLGLRAEMNSEQIEAAELFNKGMELYLKGSDNPGELKNLEELKTAFSYFKDAYRCYAEDKSSKVFMARCEKYINGSISLPKLWDGVFVMETK